MFTVIGHKYRCGASRHLRRIAVKFFSVTLRGPVSQMAQPEVTVEVATAKPEPGSVPLVLVSGATGFIASHTIQQLLISGKYRVRGTVRSLKSEEKVKAMRELVPDAKYPLELCEADLQDKDSWIPAVKGCDYVLHIASPFPSGIPKDPEEVIRPAVDGALNVLSVCADSGTVKKVVLTSSVAAVSNGGAGHPGRKDDTYTEDDWSNPDVCPPYERSKALAEKAAWEFVQGLPDEKKFDLVTICPGVVFGPLLTKNAGTSVGFIKSMLAGEVPGVVNITVMAVDVRDVAKAHISAMEKPVSNGKRYILVGESDLPFKDICGYINKEFVPQGYKASGKMTIPKFMAKFISLFNNDMSLLYPSIGKHLIFVNDRMVNELEIQPIKIEQSVIDTAYSLIEFGVVKKGKAYHGPSDKPPSDKPQEDAAQ